MKGSLTVRAGGLLVCRVGAGAGKQYRLLIRFLLICQPNEVSDRRRLPSGSGTDFSDAARSYCS